MFVFAPFFWRTLHHNDDAVLVNLGSLTEFFVPDAIFANSLDAGNNVFFFSKFKTITSSQPQLVIAPHVESQQARVVEHLCIGKKRLFACGIFRQLQGECRITHNLVFETLSAASCP